MLHRYRVLLKRDVRECADMRVEAESEEAAISAAKIIVSSDDWYKDEFLGLHRPEVVRLA